MSDAKSGEDRKDTKESAPVQEATPAAAPLLAAPTDAKVEVQIKVKSQDGNSLATLFGLIGKIL